MNLRIPCLIFCLYTAACLAASPESVVDSVHNLSVSGPGTVRAISEDRVCVFCHTPHGSRTTAPLWNRRDSSAFYTPYDSATMTAKPGQPTGSSKLCLSCHDGTIALGDLVSEDMPIAMSGSPVMPHGTSLIGTDLRDDHPISFPYSESLSGSDGDLASPGAWDPAIKLDEYGMLQCTTCHDPHDAEWGKFLVMENSRARLCRECHTIAGFDDSPHALSTNSWSGTGRNPWPHTDYTDVSANACLNCHQSHHAPGKEELLTAARDEDVCLTCHDGSVASDSVARSFRKPYRHPIRETSGAHVPGERLLGGADHVTCVDCHNPHVAANQEAEAPFVSGMMKGVSGLTVSGTPTEEALYEYEICFKCHGEDEGRSLTEINRQVTANSIRREFGPGSPSFHPVVSAGLNPDVPSLIAPLAPDSMIYCSDCHGDDAGATPAASHGSRHRYLLVAEYQTGDFVTESPTAYALCYTCHDRASILSDESFPGHRRHVVEQRTPCSVCHDAHGIDGNQGNGANNAHLINFDLSVVERLPSNGALEYTTLGAESGRCSLRCHGKDHDMQEY